MREKCPYCGIPTIETDDYEATICNSCYESHENPQTAIDNEWDDGDRGDGAFIVTI